MDDFSWGNTRLVVGEGSSKKVIVNEEEKYDESMIPLKKFSGTLPIAVVPSLLLTSCSRIRSRDMGNGYTSF